MSAWSLAESVLCVRLDAMGDVLMTTPAIRAVKTSRPGRAVTLLTSKGAATAASLVPEVDRTIVYDAPWMKVARTGDAASGDLEMIERLRAEHFDAAVIFTVYSQSPLPAALTCLLAGIPLRLAHCRENPYHLLTDWLPESEPERQVRHEVRRQLDLAGAVGFHTDDERLSLAVGPAAAEQARRQVREVGFVPRRYAVLHAGASAPSRRYPPERFVEVGRRLIGVTGLGLLLTGDASEAAAAESLREAIGPGARTLAGRLSLEQLAAVVRDAALLISNNTGPVHVAAAVGTPVVDIYALTNPQHAPWAVPHRLIYHDVPCRYCYKSVCPEGHHECLELVTPEQVVEAALDLLQSRSDDSRAIPQALPLVSSKSPRPLALPAKGGGL